MKGLNLVLALSPKIHEADPMFMKPILFIEYKIQWAIGSKDLTMSTL